MPNIGIDIKKVIYNSLVESHMIYGILIWASSLSKTALDQSISKDVPENLKMIKKAQNKVIRAIFRLPRYDKKSRTYTDMSPLYKKLGVLKLKDLYWYNMCLLCFNYLNDRHFPMKLGNHFQKKSEISSRNSRTSDSVVGNVITNKIITGDISECNIITDDKLTNNDLYFKPTNLVSTFKKPSISGSAFWNNLPLDIKETKKINSFKDKLHNYLINKY